MKKLLLFVIACTLGLFGTVRAQDDVVTIGGDATKESSVFPIPAYYGQSLSQTLYTASAINHAPATITSIAFKKISDDAVRNLTVYLKNTDKETLSDWVEFSDADKVYANASLTTSSVDGWMTLELDTEFEYTGGGIIVIAWDRTGSTSYKSGCMYTDIGSSIAVYNTNSTLTEDNYLTYTPSVSTRQPSIKFSFQNITDDLEPATPTGLVATVNDYKSISLSWNEAENAKGYNVYKNGEKIAVTGGTSYTVDGLEQTTTYCFTVTAVRGTKESAPSAEECATTDAFDGCFLDFLLSDSYGDGWTGCSINLTFSNGETKSLTLTNADGGTEPVVFSLAVPKGLVTITFTSVSYGNECSYVVKYTDGDVIYESGVGTNLETSFTVDCGSAEPESLPAPQNLAATEVTETTITLTWDAVEGATDYNVYYNISEDELVFNTGGETTYTAENLESNTGYCFNVTAVNATSESDPTELCQVTKEQEPVVEGYRLESTVKSDQWSSSTVSYTYSSETSNDVVSFDEGSYRTIVTYNTDGTVANTTYVFMLDGAPDYTSDYTVTEYTYTDGVLTSYTETKNYSWRDPETSEYTLTYNEDGTVAKVTVDNRTYAYEYEDGKLVKETYSYYAEWAGGDYIEYIKEFEYDENGNCVLETQYSLFENEDGETEKTPRKATEFYYDATISNDDVYSFEYPQAVAPAHANVITKTLSYEFQEDYFTGEISKEYFTVTVFNYNPEILATPLAPMDLKANVLSDTEVELSWTSVENGTTFTIYNGTEVVAEGVTETMYTVEGLTAATEYCFTVVSVNGEKVSEASNEACAKTMDLVNVQPSEIAFGVVRLGNYWSEVSSAINVTINPLGKEITAVESENAFFRIPATIDLTGESVVFSVNYNKSAEAGDYEGNLKVTLSTGDVVTVPMTATAYTPVTPDLFELATEVEFTEGAYENTPDFATLNKDYNLPNATENNPDAVYAFELTEDAVVTASVSANGTYAIYTEDFSGEDGPTAENAFYGNELVLGTSFSYDFENGMADFTIEDNDGNTEYTWAVEEGALKSYSYKGGYDDNGYWVTYCSEADERAITNGSYAITANTVLTFDAKFIDSYGYGVYDKVTVEVTDGESYTEIETIENFMDPATYYPVDGWMEKRVDLGAKLAELGLAYGDYQLVFRHNVSGIGSTQIDNISLTERVNVYPAGKYYLVASAAEAFTVNISYEVLDEEPEVPVAKEYRLESIEDYATTVFTYDEVYTNRVVSYEQEGFISTLSYNTNGQLVSVVDTYPGEDADGNPTMDVLSTVTYTYNADGTIATHSEETAGWAPMTTEYVYAEGKLVSTILAAYDMETEFVYNAEGLLSEKVTSYSGEVDSKEVYTYDAEGRVVDYGYYSYDAEDLQDYYLAEGVTYTYDENGDCASAKSYQVFDGEKSYFQTVEYFYDATVANEKVYSFELPHVAAVNVAPAHVSVLAKELSYYTEYNDNGDAVNHTYILTVYNYNPAVVLAPIAPMGLTAEVVEGTVTLTWEAFADAETFTVYQGETVVAENIEESTYEITGLAAGEYCYTVKAVNVKGESTASNTACVTIEGDEPVVEAPAAPENLVATVTGATTITLTWDAVEGATSYNVYGADAVIVEGLTETTYVVEDLAAETAYCFTVTAVGEGGESEESNEACATTEPDGIAENEATFNVYPNPAENVVFVETASNIEAVSIYNITGVMIYSEEGAMNNVQINVADFSAGVYVMKVRTENGEVVKHFVKK